MIKKYNFKNSDIYQKGASLLENFNAPIDLPVKVNFYLQKNMTLIVNLAREIENARNKIFETYGSLNEETQQYDFKEEDIPIVNKELAELYDLEQEVKVYMIELEWFNNMTLSSVQLASISFMINEEEMDEEIIE